MELMELFGGFWDPQGMLKLPVMMEPPGLTCFLKCHCAEKLPPALSARLCPGLEMALRFWTACKFHKSVLSHSDVSMVFARYHPRNPELSFASCPSSGFPCRLWWIWFAKELGLTAASPLRILERLSFSSFPFIESLLFVRCFTDLIFNLFSNPIG